MMAASLVGVAFMSCSSQDDVLTGGQNALTPAGQTYTMSVTAQKGGDGTRALTLVDGTTLKATWTEGDVVKVYNSTSELIGTLTAQSAGATTTLTGDLTKLPENGATLTLKYLSPSYSAQDGTLTGADNSIDKVCDCATATVTATVSGTNVTTGAAEFQNQQAVAKFTLIDKATTNTAISPTALTINDGTDDIVTLTDIPDATYNTNGAGVLFVAIPGFTGKTITLTATVGSDTYTCTTSEAKTLENGKYYGVTAKMAKQAAVPTGALSGEFSVSATKKVYFSKGNLQYDGTNWKFADSQWEVLGANGTGANGTATDYPMDLFTWGNIDSPAYNGDFYVTGSAELSGDTDWGIRMGSGWRTLSSTSDEWYYLFNSREVNGGYRAGYSYTLGQSVNNVLGVVIYPDNYAGVPYTTGANWSTFEAAGCVFLPAAGYRYGNSVSNVGNYGGYWSSTASGDYSARMVDFDNTGNWNENNAGGRHYGLSVRLVHDVAAPAPANKLLSDATAEDIGKVVGVDGKIYANVAAAQAASTTACAIIAYVGSETAESQKHGLAIAMKDAAAGYLEWKTSSGDNDNPNHYDGPASAIAAKESGSALSAGRNSDTWPAFKAALANSITEDLANGISAAAPASGTSGWFLPSLYQWNMIVKGLSGKSADMSLAANDNYTASSLNTKITAAGGTGLQVDLYYWSSTEYDEYGDMAWYFGAYYGSVGYEQKYMTNFVRSAFAF
jgi:hypothetical protein